MKCILVLIAILGATTSIFAKEIDVINIICTSNSNNINHYLQNDTSLVSGVYNATSKILSLNFSVGLASAEISVSDENGILFSNVYSIHPKDIKTIDLSSYDSDKYIIHIKSEADEEFEGFINNVHKINNIKEHVLSHYKALGDTIRYNAALFLLNNIEFHSYKHSSVLDRYYD